MNKKIQSQTMNNDWSKERALEKAGKASSIERASNGVIKKSKLSSLKQKALLGVSIIVLVGLGTIGFWLSNSEKETVQVSDVSKGKSVRILNLSDKGNGEISFGSIKDSKILEDNDALNYYSTTAKPKPQESAVPPMVLVKNTATQSTTTSARIMKIPKDMTAEEFNVLLNKGALPLEKFDFIITREEGLPEHLRQKYKESKYPIELNGAQLFPHLIKK